MCRENTQFTEGEMANINDCIIYNKAIGKKIKTQITAKEGLYEVRALMILLCYYDFFMATVEGNTELSRTVCNKLNSKLRLEKELMKL